MSRSGICGLEMVGFSYGELLEQCSDGWILFGRIVGAVFLLAGRRKLWHFLEGIEFHF